jgi:hypothetical protein
VAEVRLVAPAGGQQRRIGVAKGEFQVPTAFFEPLPEAVIAAFEGRT